MIGLLSSRVQRQRHLNRKARPGVEGLETRALLATTITEFPLPATLTAGPIAVGSDGNLWFTETPSDSPSPGIAARIGRIASDGTGLTDFAIPSGVSSDATLTLGNDGNLWFAAKTAVEEIAPDGKITTFPLPDQGTLIRSSLVSDFDGNLWFTIEVPPPPSSNPVFTIELGKVAPDGKITAIPVPGALWRNLPPTLDTNNNIWIASGDLIRVTPDGVVATFPIHQQGDGAQAYSLSPGPDGNLWFSEVTLDTTKVIGKVTPDGLITRYPVNGSLLANPSPTAGSDGAVWQPGVGMIGRITTDGKETDFPLPDTNAFATSQLVMGLDGNLWFSEQTGSGNKIALITPDGKVTELDLPPGAKVSTLSTGGDNNLWYSDTANHALGRVNLDIKTFVPLLLSDSGGRFPTAPAPIPLSAAAGPLSSSPPSVIPLSVTRSGVKHQLTHLKLTFTAALDPITASDSRNFTMVLVGPKGHSRPHARSISVKAASYDPATHSVTLTTNHRLKLSGYYRLTVNGASPTGLKSAGGLKMAGNSKSNFVTIIHQFGTFTPKAHKKG